MLEKIEKKHGQIIYRLQKLNKTTPAIEGDVVEYWGKFDKEVAVLMLRGGCTLMKKGYDKETGAMLFNPLPHDRINMIKGEMMVRKDRLQQEKDILSAITPWIVSGICMLGLIMMCYILGMAFVEMSEQLGEMVEESNAMLLQIEQLRQGVTPTQHDLGSQPIQINTTPS